MSETLEGKLLIAMPGMLDDAFSNTTVLLCAHSREGAMGLVVNRVRPKLSLHTLLGQIDEGAKLDSASPDLIESIKRIPIYHGGPVESSRGFVLHSPDYFSRAATVTVAPAICLTATLDILSALASGNGPRNVLIALGYAAWAPGQLEQEIQANGWLHTDATPDIVFRTEPKARYGSALAQLGVNPSHLVTAAGHA
ncbi:MAG: YqgE/AlgH family protein [Hyphomicrobiaceae bacterium]